jgi:hypothetical protein
MKESPPRVVALVSYTLRTKAGTLRVEDDGQRWTPGEALPPRDVKANAPLALCRHVQRAASEFGVFAPQPGADRRAA